MLKFSEANTKTQRLKDIPELSQYLTSGRKVYSLDLLAGWSCPGAKDCQARVYLSKITGKKYLLDGPNTQFRCFSASQEVLYTNVYDLRKHNFDTLRKCQCSTLDLLKNSLPKNIGILRYHVSGDFFSRDYLDAAIRLARFRPDVLFYAYTKSLHHLWQLRRRCKDLSQGIIRDNFLITASYGGKYDSYIEKLGIRTAKVVFSESEAGDLPIDHDDSHNATKGGSFALLLHGTQPKGSIASQALVDLKGVGSYSRKVAV